MLVHDDADDRWSDCPFQWLIDVAVRVDEWVQAPRVRQRFQTMLHEWLEERPKPDGPATVVLPAWGMILSEKYAALAAIHDRICPTRRIEQRGIRRASKKRRRTELGIPFYILRTSVNALTENHRERLEDMLKVVEQDLIDRALLPDRSIEVRSRVPATPHPHVEDATAPPLTEPEQQVLGIIKQQPPDKAISGQAIVDELGRRGRTIVLSTLTRHIIPRLKAHHRVRNRRGAGYYITST